MESVPSFRQSGRFLMAYGDTQNTSFLSPEDFLGADPQLEYFSFQDQFGRGQKQRDYFKSQFSDILNQFRGSLGSTLQQGNIPTNTFSDFLENYNFGQQFGQIAPSMRGATTSRFAPTSRFLNF